MISHKTDISHHISDAMLAAYASGNLDWHYSLVVATHVSMCDECRARLSAHEAAGGAVLQDFAQSDMSASAKAALFDRLDDTYVTPKPAVASGIYPAPLTEALNHTAPNWKPLGFGVKQAILRADKSGSVRLLHIPGGEAVPEHSHRGIEMTLVLQGAFSDETGRFGVGDVEIADDDLNHQPIAEEGEACICLAATGAPLRFNSIMPRIFQPLFRI